MVTNPGFDSWKWTAAAAERMLKRSDYCVDVGSEDLTGERFAAANEPI